MNSMVKVIDVEESEELQVKFSWVIKREKAYLVAYDLRHEKLIPSVMDYAQFLSDKERLDVKTVKNEITFLKALFDFLEDPNDLETVNNEVLEKFRDEELKRVMNRKNSYGMEPTSKRTVNSKIRRIYLFFYWCQSQGHIPNSSIGEQNCKIYAKCSDRESRAYRKSGAIQYAGKIYHLPLLYRGVGAASRNRPRHFATNEEKSLLRAYFQRNCTEFVFVRNMLIMEIADVLGLRRGSINSLTCNQFELAHEGVHKSIIPPAQKFGYVNSFEMDSALALKIQSFIYGPRKEFLNQMGWDEDRASNRVFISAKDGRPLTNQALSAIFGAAFKAIGVKVGAGLHSFRRKSVEEQTEKELRARIALGLDTSMASLTAALAIKFGWSNPASFEPYVHRAHTNILKNKENG